MEGKETLQTKTMEFTPQFPLRDLTGLIDEKLKELKELIEEDENEHLVLMRFTLVANEEGDEGLLIHHYVDGKEAVIKKGISSLIKSKDNGALFIYRLFLNYFVKTVTKKTK